MCSIYHAYSNSDASAYYYLLRLIYFFVGQDYFIEGVIIAHLYMGICSCLYIVYITKKLTLQSCTACLSGVIFALYAPVLMYEGVILKETFYLFIVLLVLFLCFYLDSGKFSLPGILGFSIAVIIPGLIRGAGVAFTGVFVIWFIYALSIYTFKNEINKIKILICKLLLFFSSCFLFLLLFYYGYNKQLPVIFSAFSNYQYFFSVGQQKELVTINQLNKKVDAGKRNLKTEKGQKDYLKIIKNFNRNFLLSLRAYEMPNNVNYYFIRGLLLPLKYLLGPILLFPIALSGFIIFISRYRKYNRPGLIFIYTIPVLISCIVFLPLARYRILVIPVMSITASIFIVSMFEYIFLKKYIQTILLCCCLIFFSYLHVNALENSYLRAADYIAYGQAMRFKNPNSPVIINCFKYAYQLRPDLAFTQNNLIIELLRIGDFVYAEKLLKQQYMKFPDNYEIVSNYVAALMGTKQYKKVYNVLLKYGKPYKNSNLWKYYFNWGEYYYFTGDYVRALKYYKNLIDICKDQKLKFYINKRIESIYKQVNNGRIE